MTAITTVKKQRGKPFPPGVSGNANGRPRASLNKTTIALQSLLSGQGEAISQKAVELALNGNIAAIRLIMERIMPICKEAPIELDMPIIKTSADIVGAVSSVVNAVACGQITPSQGQAMTAMISDLTHAIEVNEIAARLAALEQRVPK